MFLFRNVAFEGLAGGRDSGVVLLVRGMAGQGRFGSGRVGSGRGGGPVGEGQAGRYVGVCCGLSGGGGGEADVGQVGLWLTLVSPHPAARAGVL